jgi:hypothetical protein
MEFPHCVLADLGFVDDVVVNERCGVDDLDDSRELYGTFALVPEKLSREQQQRGTNTLAAAGTQIFTNLGYGGDVRDCVASKFVFDRGDVVAQKIEDFFPVDGRRRTQGPGRSGD